MGAVGNQKIAAVNALGFHACNFLKYNCGVNNYAVAEDIDFIFVQYAGGQKTQFIGNIVYNNGVPCVGAAGITYNSVGFLSQVINNLASSPHWAPITTTDDITISPYIIIIRSAP